MMFKTLFSKLMQFIMAKPDGPEALDMAMEMLMEKAQTGEAQAQYEIGLYYLQGKYFNQDIPAALRWLALAAKQYHVPAEALLAYYYHQHLTQYPDYTQPVVNWAEHAALRSNLLAQSVWGEILIHGLAQQPASPYCLQYLQHAAEWQEQPEHITNTQRLLEKSATKIPRLMDYFGASSTVTSHEVDYLKHAQHQQQLRAQYLLGTLYLQGRWVAQDNNEARYWIELSAKQGYQPAQLQLSQMYQQGIAVTQSDTEAAYWEKQAKKL